MAASCVVRGERSDRRVSPFRRSGGIIARMFWFRKTKLGIGEGIRPQITQIFGEGKGGGEGRRKKDRSANRREFSPMNFVEGGLVNGRGRPMCLPCVSAPQRFTQIILAPFQLLRSPKSWFKHFYVCSHFVHKTVNILIRQITIWCRASLGYNSAWTRVNL